MAFDSQVSVEYKKYMGVGRVKIVAVNPNLNALKTLGVQFKDEPVYSKVDEAGVKQINFNFWTKAQIDGKDVLSPIKMFVKDKISESSAGKIEFINDRGENQWVAKGESPSETQYFAMANPRQAYVGETALISLLKSWMNVRKGGTASIKLEPMFKGNFSELKDLVSNNDLYVMYMIADEKYQNIYSRYFVRGFVSQEDAETQFKNYIQKQTDSGYAPKEDYTITLQEWSGVMPDNELAPPTMNEQVPGSDLPF